ncbi:hypothetical protein SUDANB121_00910 [Nocardiopsis dassonvillei]|uniref:DUF5959 family protein n=1 Tax=Nocardiopsis dassonvillei TaxID=2014 RepID=UPI003F56A7CC
MSSTPSGGPPALDLFRFHDPHRAVAVTVTVPDTPGAGYMDGELVVESDFVRGRLRLAVTGADLDDWERRLDDLAADRAVEWPPSDRSAWLSVVPDDPFTITVHDTPSTQVEVRVPVEVREDWPQENRARLERVRRAWEAVSS